jgi:hypothetical protein
MRSLNKGVPRIIAALWAFKTFTIYDSEADPVEKSAS